MVQLPFKQLQTVQKALNGMNHFEAAGSQSVMEIDSIRCNEEEVYAIGDVPDGYIAILQDLMVRHGECQVHFTLPSGMANGVVIDNQNL